MLTIELCKRPSGLILDKYVYFLVSGLNHPLYLAMRITKASPAGYLVTARALTERAYRILSNRPNPKPAQRCDSDPILYKDKDEDSVLKALEMAFNAPDEDFYNELLGVVTAKGDNTAYSKEVAEPVVQFLIRYKSRQQS